MVYITIALIIGILLNEFLNATAMIPLIAIFLSIILIIIRKWNLLFLLIILLMIVFGFTLSSYKYGVFDKSLNEAKYYAEKSIEYSGIVVKSNHYSSGQRFTLKNINIKSENSSFNEKIKYSVYPKEQLADNVFIGDTLQGTGKWQLFNEKRNPGEYDFKKYYHNKTIAGRIYSKSGIQIHSNPSWSIRKSINNLRENVRSRLTAYSDHETRALLSALILGDRTKIDQELRKSFANVGVIHVLAVSGLHVGYVLVILLLIVKSFRIRWGYDKLFVVLGLILFTILSGGRPSVIRASIMASLYIFAQVFDRKPNALNIIATAAFLILILDPNLLFDMGFQLSFAAVISIIYFYNLLNKILPEKLRVSNIKNNVVRFFWGLLLVSFSAQLGTIPIIAHYFGRISLIAIIANLFIIPLIGGFVALGLAKLALFWIMPFSFFIDQVIWLIKELIYATVAVFDKFPYASILTPQFNWLNLFQYLLAVIIIFLIIQRKYSKIIIFGSLLINSFLWPWVLNKQGMDIIFLDLNKNESTIVKNSDKKSVLINTGIINQFSNDLNRKILPAVKHLNIKKFDWLIKSQGNSNHQIGLAKTIENIPIDEIWDVANDPESWITEYIRNMIELRNIDYHVIRRGEVIRIDNQTYLQFLLPVIGDQVTSSAIAYKIVHGSNSILSIDKLTDADFEVLIKDREVLKSDILKMSYPKQITSNIIEFVSTVDADMAIITGARGSKNSPTQKDLNALFDSELFFTESIGAVWLYSNGEQNIKVKQWK
ncbi:MAG: DNA internalization-related competence protein ComEC/Rec2 [Candidatus Neomarinimicrobiota bacterium]